MKSVHVSMAACFVGIRLPIFLLLLTGTALAGVAPHVASQAADANKVKKKKVTTVESRYWTNEYDRHFRKYTKRYFGPGKHWKWFKAQAIAESGLSPKIRSHVGAVGLMQIMPSTFADIRKQNPYFSSIEDPRWNIAAGIWYDRQLYKHWNEKVPSFDDRLAFTFGSYNAGLGGMLKAWKRSGMKNKDKARRQWDKVRRFAPKETQGYVARIRELMGES